MMIRVKTMVAFVLAVQVGLHAQRPAATTRSTGGRSACSEKAAPEVRNNPAAPKHEPVVISELPLPPTAPGNGSGSCTQNVNPHGTGCISPDEYGIEEGPSYSWDGKHVLLTIKFSGAPANSPTSDMYSGEQVIAIKTDGSLFPNGDAWKCLTCGVPDANKQGVSQALDHPQPFHDGKRILAGTSILDCSPYRVTDASCGPQQMHMYPIRWSVTADNSGLGGYMRELRLNPDDVHLGWNHPVLDGHRLDQFGLFGRLQFNATPSSGVPLVPRYDITAVTVLYSPSPNFQTFSLDPNHSGELTFNPPTGIIGEFRGWTSDGRSALGIGIEESGNFDGYATSLATGASQRLTRDPAYTDPMRSSPDDK
jgi:hypothetical protein